MEAGLDQYYSHLQGQIPLLAVWVAQNGASYRSHSHTHTQTLKSIYLCLTQCITHNAYN